MLECLFRLAEHRTSVQIEVLAGLSTFLTRDCPPVSNRMPASSCGRSS